MTDFPLTFAERVIIANQFKILEAVDPGNASDYAQSREIVEKGYASLYETINPAVSTGSVAPETGREVDDILSMFQAIEGSATRLDKAPGDLSVSFEGFHADEDGTHYEIATFVRRKLGRWGALAHYPDDASRSVLGHYRQMLRRWDAIGRPAEMTEDQLAALRHHT